MTQRSKSYANMRHDRPRRMTDSRQNPPRAEASRRRYFVQNEIERFLTVLNNGSKVILDSYNLTDIGQAQGLLEYLSDFRQRNIAVSVQKCLREGNRAEFVKLLDEISLMHQELVLMFHMALDLGPRVNELLKLKWSQIVFDSDPPYVNIYDEKKDKYRDSIMMPATWDLLKSYRDALSKTTDERTMVYVFSFKEKTANRHIKDLAKKAGIYDWSKVRFHDFRHTHIYQSKEAGRDWPEISLQTGDRATTLQQEYSKLTREDRQRKANEHPLIRIKNEAEGD